MVIRNLEKTLLTNHSSDKWNDLEQYISTLDHRRNIKVTDYIPDFYNYA